MSNETIREQIILTILTGLADVKVINGFEVEYVNVCRAKGKHDPGSLPLAVVWPKPETSSRLYGCAVNVMPIKIEVLTMPGAENVSVVSEKILGDLIVVMDVIRKSTSLVDDMEYKSGGSEGYPDDSSGALGVTIEYEVKYQTVSGDPFSQPL